MRKYLLSIYCELLNEIGILVSHNLKTIVHEMPQVSDKFMFIAAQYYRPIVIRIMSVDSHVYAPQQKECICIGEEIDDLDNIKEVFPEPTFIIVD